MVRSCGQRLTNRLDHAISDKETTACKFTPLSVHGDKNASIAQ
jgi:hypothetical protein